MARCAGRGVESGAVGAAFFREALGGGKLGAGCGSASGGSAWEDETPRIATAMSLAWRARRQIRGLQCPRRYTPVYTRTPLTTRCSQSRMIRIERKEGRKAPRPAQDYERAGRIDDTLPGFVVFVAGKHTHLHQEAAADNCLLALSKTQQRHEHHAPSNPLRFISATRTAINRPFISPSSRDIPRPLPQLYPPMPTPQRRPGLSNASSLPTTKPTRFPLQSAFLPQRVTASFLLTTK